MIEILKKGFLTVPVSSKRHGMEALGVSSGGPMDPLRAVLANRLAGNPDDAAVLEACFMLPELRFTDRRAFSVLGTESAVILRNGEKLLFPCSQTLYAEPGDVLVSGPVSKGMRAYLAFSGGIRLNGFLPSPASDGDYISLADAPLPERRELLYDPLPVPGNEAVLRVIEGVQTEHFSEEGIRTFYSEPYLYTPKSDRMGIRLSGPVIGFSEGHDGNILSESVRKGDIQVTSSGQPILLMAGCQTSGGYAKIAHVITADLPAAAQARPGAFFRFAPVSVFEAQAILHRMAEKLDRCVIPAGSERQNHNGKGNR